MKKLDKDMVKKVAALVSEMGAMKTALDEVDQQAEAYAEEKSEKWQEGEAGQAHAAWREALSEAMDALDVASDSLDAIVPEGI